MHFLGNFLSTFDKDTVYSYLLFLSQSQIIVETLNILGKIPVEIIVFVIQQIIKLLNNFIFDTITSFAAVILQ